MTIECVKRQPNPQFDKFSGFCNNCKSEFTALRKDLRLKKANNEGVINCYECNNGMITFTEVNDGS